MKTSHYPQEQSEFVGLAENVARDIMGGKLFGKKEWLDNFGEEWVSGIGRQQIPAFPWNASLLESSCPFQPSKRVSETHFAFLGCPYLGSNALNLERIVSAQDLFWATRGRAFEKSDASLSRTCHLRWYLMPISTDTRAHEVKTGTIPLSTCPAYDVAYAVEEMCKIYFYLILFGEFPRNLNMFLVRIRDYKTHDISLLFT